jgi:hypothetical protein
MARGGMSFADIEGESIQAIPVVLVVDDPVRVRADLRPGWNCHLLRQPISCRDLSEFAMEILQAAPGGPRSAGCGATDLL